LAKDFDPDVLLSDLAELAEEFGEDELRDGVVAEGEVSAVEVDVVFFPQAVKTSKAIKAGKRNFLKRMWLLP
jgi:hypothetical protein